MGLKWWQRRTEPPVVIKHIPRAVALPAPKPVVSTSTCGRCGQQQLVTDPHEWIGCPNPTKRGRS